MALAGVYDTFNDRWCKQTVWIYSDPHFGDAKLANEINRPSDEEQIAKINEKVGRKDTLICLGDVGNVECVRKLRGYKVLICGNHDAGASNYKRQIITKYYDFNNFTKEQAIADMKIKYPSWRISAHEGYDVCHAPFHYWEIQVDNQLFDEVYEGPLMIGEKLFLSHEPVALEFALNIHGHDHSNWNHKDWNHLNVCSDVINYTPINLNQLLKTGLTAKVPTIHRETIDDAIARKKRREKHNKKS